MRILRKFLLFLTIQQAYGSKEQRICRETEITADLVCEGNHLSIQCPREIPYINIEYAEYGREEPEYKICPRPQDSLKNNDAIKSNLSCNYDVLSQISDFCGDKRSCSFKVNSSVFYDPCPKTYKYLQILYKCVCTRRHARNIGTTTTCFTPFSSTHQTTSTTLTPVLTSTPALKDILIKSHYSVPRTSTPYLVSTTTYYNVPSSSIISNYTLNSAQPRQRMTMTLRRKFFFIMLDLFIIYNETLEKDSTLAILWCFLGVLIGLALLTLVTLLIIKLGKPKDKEMFRLSQVEPDETNLESPTIRVSDPSALETSDTRLKLENGGIPKTNKEDTSNLSSHEPCPTYSKANTVVFTNPLWTALRENGDGTDRSSVVDIHNTNGLDDDNSENTTMRTNNNDDNSENTAMRTNNNNQSLSPHNVRRNDNRKFKRTFCFPPSETSRIPVGIPSRPVSIDSILLQDGRVRWDIECPPHSPHDDMYPQVPSNRRRSVESGENSAPSSLFSKFGDIHENSYNTLPCRRFQPRCALSDSALSSMSSSPSKKPQKSKKPDNSIHQPNPTAEAKNLDASRSPKPTTTSAMLNNNSPKNKSNNNKEQPKLDKCNTNDNNQNTKRPPNSSKIPKGPTPQKEKRLQPIGNYENMQNIPKNRSNVNTNGAKDRPSIPEREPEGSDRDKRVSSGYYSNTTSPSREYPKRLDGLQRPNKSNTNNGINEINLDHKEPPDGDDLPPLPPPAEPLSPPSPSKLYASSLRPSQSKLQGEGKKKDRIRLAERKVHFS